MKNTNKKIQGRAIKVHINAGKKAGTSYVAQGKKAGQFASKTSSKRRIKASRGTRWTVIKAVFKFFFSKKFAWFLFTITCLSYLFSTTQIGFNQFDKVEAKPVTIQVPQVELPIAPPVPQDLFDKYFGSEAGIMRAICEAENGTKDPGRLSGRNKDGTYDYGLCQINTVNSKLWEGENIYDSDVNIKVAKKLRTSWGNFGAWTTYNSGKYLKYLK